MAETITGLYKLNVYERLEMIASYTSDPQDFINSALIHLHPNATLQKQYESISENTLTNYYLPFNIAPNFLVNNTMYHLPMVIEESSVVAAASGAAKFWQAQGGFQASVLNTEKVGQVHFKWYGKNNYKLRDFLNNKKTALVNGLKTLTDSMDKRGGGIKDITLNVLNRQLPDTYQLLVTFNTANAMGANFINTVLEQLASDFCNMVANYTAFTPNEQRCDIIMAILSNYTPECRVRVNVKAPFSAFNKVHAGMSGKQFAEKFKLAVDIAQADVYRATTHNKGIFNGMDAVVLATGNDFRALEAAGHAYAARSGVYKSLSECVLTNDTFVFSLEVPMAIGTVGGLTSLHPMARWALDILGNPGAETLMKLVAAAGLANNYSAVKALITKGIQHGHMRMHLSNIYASMQVTADEKQYLDTFFSNKEVSVSAVKAVLLKIRGKTL